MKDARPARQARRFLNLRGLSLKCFRAEDGEHLRLHRNDRATPEQPKAKPPKRRLEKDRTVSEL